MKILLIEDDNSIAKLVSWGLSNERIYCDCAPDGVSGLKMAASSSYDLIILDLLLPGKSGEEVCRQLRHANYTMPIIILTAITDLQSKVRLLDLGADDYVTKPFEFEELYARIKALLRKQKIELGSVLVYDDIKIDLKKHEVTKRGSPVSLREKEIKILEYLVRHAEQVLTREMILSYVWGPAAERFTNVVDVHIHHLRQKIDKPWKSRLVKTVSSLGYKLSK